MLCFVKTGVVGTVTWEKLKSDEDKFLPKRVASTIIETECFFHLSGFFVENLKEKLNNFYSIFPTVMEKLNKFYSIFPSDVLALTL